MNPEENYTTNIRLLFSNLMTINSRLHIRRLRNEALRFAWHLYTPKIPKNSIILYNHCLHENGKVICKLVISILHDSYITFEQMNTWQSWKHFWFDLYTKDGAIQSKVLSVPKLTKSKNSFNNLSFHYL